MPGSHRWEGSSVSYRKVGGLVKSTEYYIKFKSFIGPKAGSVIDALTIEIEVSSDTGGTTDYALLTFSSISVPVVLNFDNRNSIRLRSQFANNKYKPFKMFAESNVQLDNENMFEGQSMVGTWTGTKDAIQYCSTDFAIMPNHFRSHLIPSTSVQNIVIWMGSNTIQSTDFSLTTDYMYYDDSDASQNVTS